MDDIKCKKLIGLIVKNKRDELGLTQEELSAQLDIDQSNLSNIENGKNYPSFTTFCTLVETLNIEPNEFLSFLKFSNNSKEAIDIDIQEYIKPLSTKLKTNVLEILKKINE